jgi:hypothetical protein
MPRFGRTSRLGSYRSSYRTTLRGNHVRLGLPLKAARTEGPPKIAAAPLGQSREALLAARPLHSPEGGHQR